MFTKDISKVDCYCAGFVRAAVIVGFALLIGLPNAQAQAGITQVFELLKDAEQFEWTDLSGNSLEKGSVGQ